MIITDIRIKDINNCFVIFSIFNLANIYIRPIQNNLSTKPVETYSTQDELLFQSECYKCKKMFKLRELREHTEMCDGIF
jgi:hypothetical protein